MKILPAASALLAVCLIAVQVNGAEPARGVAGIDVVLKQRPNLHAVTDGGGNFVLTDVPRGAYTLSLRGGGASHGKSGPADKAAVAESYSIKIEGAKRPITQSGVASAKLMSGLDIAVQTDAGGRIQGRVTAGAVKKMVWIAQETGSNIPGHWVEAGSPEARGKATVTHSREDMNAVMNRGNANMTDPMTPQPGSAGR